MNDGCRSDLMASFEWWSCLKDVCNEKCVTE